MRPAHFLKFLRSYLVEKPDAIVIREVKVLPFLIFKKGHYNSGVTSKAEYIRYKIFINCAVFFAYSIGLNK